ncbi:hypothetical protein [Mesorhizobium sp. B2-3-15]|uniref:hypothetical protein n=1 Tax=Mesorhizobium sp. B2-3-15 TaxID=2589949 RepID=UPI00112920D5|nr:hypothetical protein [Mesorhizobium sp. B2-3-15]TPL75124.1 hypothetical protein FJ954_09210 [Mesorhizobium sp. B2-3-15]
MTVLPGFPQLRRFFGSFHRRDSVTIAVHAAPPPTIEAGKSIMNQLVNRRSLVASTAIAASGALVPFEAGANLLPHDEALVALAAQFEEHHTKYRVIHAQCERTHSEFEEKHGEPERHLPFKDHREYWTLRHVQCDPITKECEDAAIVLDEIGKRMRAIPAHSVAGIAAKATTLQFDTSLYPDQPEAPLNEWNWDVECLHLFIEEVRRLAAATA